MWEDDDERFAEERAQVAAQKRLAAAREREWLRTGIRPTDDEPRGTDE